MLAAFTALAQLRRILFVAKEKGLLGFVQKSLRRKAVREEGLEPTRLSTPDPKSGASANSATLAMDALDHSNVAHRGALRSAAL